MSTISGYSFVAPSILLTKTGISDVVLECSGDTLSMKPNAVNVIRLRIEVSILWTCFFVMNDRLTFPHFSLNRTLNFGKNMILSERNQLEKVPIQFV